MSIADARKALESERRDLQRQLDVIDKALAVLDAPGTARANGARAKSRPRKTSRADLTEKQALERYGAEALTCPECGRIARAPQGMKAHLRSHAS